MDSVDTQRVTAEEIAHYQAHGWVRVSGLLSSATVRRLSDAADVAMTSNVDRKAWDGQWANGFPDAGDFLLETKHDIHMNADWRAVTMSPQVTDVVAALMGVDRVGILQSTIISKPPKHGQAFPPHQDSSYYANGEPRTVVAMFHLENTTAENGPIRYLDGSHLNGWRPHTRAGKSKKYLAGVALEDMTEVCAQAGDLVCANIHTVHGSYPNRSDRARRLVRVVYQPA